MQTPEEHSPVVPAGHHKFSDEVRGVLAFANGKALTLGQIIFFLRSRGLASITFILSLPFLLPIPLPGLSMVFGMVVFFIGAKIALGHTKELPAFINNRIIPYETLENISLKSIHFLSKIERFFRPRWFFFSSNSMRRIAGVFLVGSGIALSLPFPPIVLFSNSFPALGIVFICIGLIEEDGVFIFLGLFVELLSWIYFIFWIDLLVVLAESVLDCYRGDVSNTIQCIITNTF